MNNTYGINNNDVGIDPTTINTIDSLDLTPPADKKFNATMKGSTPDPDKKKNSTFKKIIFTLFILLIMAGVGYGVYYYLSLANSKKTGDTKPDKPIMLKDRKVVVGTDITKYLNENFKDCTIDKNEVDSTQKGKYKYTLICNNSKYEGNIIVEEIEPKNISTNFLVASKEEELKPEFFVDSPENYIYTFKDEKTLEENLNNNNQIYPVDINISSEKGDDVVTALLFVNEKKADHFLNCMKDNENYFFNIDDTFSYFGPSLFTLTVIYEKNDFYNNLINVENGKLSYKDENYYINYLEEDLTIEYNEIVTIEELEKKFNRTLPTNEASIMDYFIKEGYYCKSTLS